MTKKDLLQKIDTWGVDHIAITGIKDCVKQFFDSNVCIPKGEHRHKDAEALHEWVEGAKIEKRPNGGSWCNTAGVNQHFDGSIRIKPSEPIYEWQWYDIDRNREVFIVNRGHFITEDESGELTTFGQMRKFEETKRERTWIITNHA